MLRNLLQIIPINIANHKISRDNFNEHIFDGPAVNIMIFIKKNQPQIKNICWQFREAAKIILFLVAGPLRGGGRLNRCATKKKITFFNVGKKVPKATKPRGGGLKALVAGPLRK